MCLTQQRRTHEPKRLCGGCGADRVYMESLCRLTMTHATNSGGRTPGSKLPASPPPWPSRPAGRRAKQPQVPKHNKLNTEPVQMKSRGNLNATLDRNKSTVSSNPSEETTRATKEVKQDEHQNTGDTTRATRTQAEEPKRRGATRATKGVKPRQKPNTQGQS